jgi:hypothetical protein
MADGEPTKKKRVKFKTIDIDTEEVALILKYDVEVVLIQADGESTVESKQSTQTKIRVKTLNASSNVEKLARQISDKCKQIPPSKVPLVVTKLYELQMAVAGGGEQPAAPVPAPAPAPAPAEASPEAARDDGAEHEAAEREQREQDETMAQQRRELDEMERRRKEQEADAERERAEQERQAELDRDREQEDARVREGLEAQRPEEGAGGMNRTPSDLGAWGDREPSPSGEGSAWGNDADQKDKEKEREQQRAAAKAERERKEKDFEEKEARRKKERAEAEAERQRQKDLQKQFAAQRTEDFELRQEDEVERKKEEAQMEKIRKQMDKVSFDKLDSYIEMLYDDTEKQVKGTHRILLLARNPDHLEELLMNETLLGVICRLFKEEGRKSVDLVTNIAYVFYSFSVYSKFHPEISQQKVGALALGVVESELERSAVIANDLATAETKIKGVQKGSREEEKLQKEIKRIRSFTRKQDKLLIVSLHILLNLAEDTKVEKKMKKRKIIERLLTVLERRNLELRQLAIMFLKKLSIFKENKNEMAKLGIVEKLSKLVPQDHQPLLIAALRLLSNLSFDPTLRKQMIMADFPPKLCEVFKRAKGPVAELTLRCVPLSFARKRPLSYILWH